MICYQQQHPVEAAKETMYSWKKNESHIYISNSKRMQESGEIVKVHTQVDPDTYSKNISHSKSKFLQMLTLIYCKTSRLTVGASLFSKEMNDTWENNRTSSITKVSQKQQELSIHTRIRIGDHQEKSGEEIEED